MHKFVRQLITEWRRLKLPVDKASVVVAVSGGADSCSLLLALHDLRQRGKLDLRIVAAHFNHRLRGHESDSDEEFVKQLTTKLGVELAIGHARPDKKGNLEQNARDARYRFLGDTAKQLGAFAVCTAHTMNDQAETFLMNLIRGSGPDGLRGMKPVRSFEFRVPSSPATFGNSKLETPNSKLILVRPLLTWAKRSNTVGLCHDLGVECRHDSMNDDTALRRVRIRKILLPLLEDMNPNIIETLANTAALMQQSNVKPALESAEGNDSVALIKDLKQLSQSEQYEWIRAWLRRKRGSTRALQLKHIQSIERLILSTKSGRAVELPGNASVIRTGGKLIYEQNKVENSAADN
ncbi:MAG: tRNA lysidine(34) synthetase TilS [Pyrinomonadaceae bacterium]